MGRWQRYWFAEGGRTAVAILRIAIASSVLMTLYRLATLSTVHIPGPPELYRPVGVWMLFGYLVPPDLVITSLWVIAIASTIAMLIGISSRVSTAISFVSALALTSGSFASSQAWSHQYNVVFLAQLAFLGARGGDTLSLDAWLRHRRGLPEIDVARGYQWSLRLVQLAVALMFSGAAFHKMLHAHFTLRWALSDNLRHQLLVRFDLADLPRPPVANWIIDNVWRYRTAAMLNLVSQATPILACIFIKRPLVRLVGGMFFVIETLALGLVVNLWNLHWLPLLAVFIDWDWALGLVGRRPVAAELPAGWSPPRRVRIFLVAFIAYDVTTAFIPTIDQTLNTYPFSAFPMFANVRAREPYAEHLPYSLPGDQFEAISDKPLDDHAQRWLDHMNRRLYLVTGRDEFERRLRAILADTQARFPAFGIHGLRHRFAIFEAPAYPAPARFDVHPIAVMGEIGSDGVFRSVLGKLSDQEVTLGPMHVDTTNARLEVYENDEPTPRELTTSRTGDRFSIPKIDSDRFYIVAVIDGKPWFVATRKLWRWE